ncbi:MAG: tRNA (adenosine(37)-N6)-threonylcarbamoyltransferase complex ATPase subunit type 1 TsaE [Deltaproteobacteria bacterium]|nr:tRNA (adenosine(37)-N6)-threonylcarbamoyltransferase complex ATPase subunit type 1 TsaE [Deltaproteobacteria bacterium]
MREVEPGEGIWEVQTKGPDQTQHLGRIFGEMLGQGSVVALRGDLGSGKTVLAKGIAQGLGVEDEGEVTSPSFVLVNEYQGRVLVHHVDLYRLQRPGEGEDLGLEEFISGPGVTLVEWAEKVPSLLPEERVEVHLHWVSPGERKLVFVGKGRAAKDLVDSLGHKWRKMKGE